MCKLSVVVRIAVLAGLVFEARIADAQDSSPQVRAAEPDDSSLAAARGYRVLRTKPFLPADFDDEVFDTLWKIWPEPLRTQAKNASPKERRLSASFIAPPPYLMTIVLSTNRRI